MRRASKSRKLETQTAVSFIAEELQRLADESAAKETGEGAIPPHEPATRSEIEQALDATWKRSEAVYGALADEHR